MMATWAGMQIDELVLLSCPYHKPRPFRPGDLSSFAASDCRYLPDFPEVPRIKVIRVRLDQVIIADRGHQHFPRTLARFHAHPPVGWFNHHATHEPAVWQQHNIDKWVGHDNEPAPVPGMNAGANNIAELQRQLEEAQKALIAARARNTRLQQKLFKAKAAGRRPNISE
jgi:hypothetical protein